MKKYCIERICNFPVDFKTSNKSTTALLNESKFAEIHTVISLKDIKDYLTHHKHLIAEWEIWSQDKRTENGYYLTIDSSSSFVGSLRKINGQVFEKTFPSDIDACAEFILREVSTILNTPLE